MKWTPTHYTIIIVVVIIAFFGIAGYDMYLKNQPPVTPIEQIEEVVGEIFKGDSIIEKPIKVVYKYEEIDFASNGDTTYWFYIGRRKTKKASIENSRVIKFPHSHFDFYKAAELINHKETDTEQIFITYIKQISEASYKSYDAYSNKW